jgi:hypothetical protein
METTAWGRKLISIFNNGVCVYFGSKQLITSDHNDGVETVG